jgi:hypothetical protein
MFKSHAIQKHWTQHAATSRPLSVGAIAFALQLGCPLLMDSVIRKGGRSCTLSPLRGVCPVPDCSATGAGVAAAAAVPAVQLGWHLDGSRGWHGCGDAAAGNSSDAGRRSHTHRRSSAADRSAGRQSNRRAWVLRIVWSWCDKLYFAA